MGAHVNYRHSMFSFLRLLVVITGWLVSAVFVGAYAAYYVRPGALWWFQVLALGLPALTVLLVPLAIGSFVLKHRMLGAVQVLLLLLFLLRHAPFGLMNGEVSAEGATPVRILTYNTHGGVGYVGGGDAGVVKLVQETDPDVVCLQEFGAESARARPGTASRELDGLGYRHIAPSPEGRRETRRPILTRLPIEETALLPLSGGAESYATRAVVQGENGPFSIYNVHLVGFSSDRPWRGPSSILDPRDWLSFFRNSGGAYILRAEEASALREHLDVEELPHVVCGDFNTTSNQWAYHHVTDNLQDTFELAGEGWGKTYHARLPVVRIDYVFASQDWNVITSDVLTTGASDHRAVLAELELQ